MVARVLSALLILSCAQNISVAQIPSEKMLSASGNPLSREECALLEKGEVIVKLSGVAGSAMKQTVAVALINSAPEKVIAVLTRYDEFPSFMPYCKTTEVRQKEGEVSTVYFALDFPWPIGDKHYVLKLTDKRYDVAGRVVFVSSWTYEPGSGNIKDSYGSWEVRAYDAKQTFVRYTVFTDPGGKIPTWANNMATEVAVPKVIEGLRRKAAETSGEIAPNEKRGEKATR